MKKGVHYLTILKLELKDLVKHDAFFSLDFHVSN